MGQTYPPSTQLQQHQFRIGRDHHGHWVVQDDSGLTGGLFVTRSDALKFALFENGNRPQAVIMMPGLFELDMTPHPKTPGETPHTARAA
jgi:hypothetical protein